LTELLQDRHFIRPAQAGRHEGIDAAHATSLGRLDSMVDKASPISRRSIGYRRNLVARLTGRAA
jgi:hypothetical protein